MQRASETKVEDGKLAPPPLGSTPLGGTREEPGQAPPPIASAGVLLTRLRDGKGGPEVLAIRRRAEPGAAWEFPKGSLEPTDPSKLACAVRERAARCASTRARALVTGSHGGVVVMRSMNCSQVGTMGGRFFP